MLKTLQLISSVNIDEANKIIGLSKPIKSEKCGLYFILKDEPDNEANSVENSNKE